ncbi:MAG: hypothetical protein JW837_08930 [Sedimentisphaerales bacterium]|nr:hypothetical protein [Sedimentisphaerales bacterium]
MKTLIVTIITAILTLSLTGCTFVREYHRGYAHDEVIVTRPWHPPVGYPRHAPPHFPGRHHPGHGPWHR